MSGQERSNPYVKSLMESAAAAAKDPATNVHVAVEAIAQRYNLPAELAHTIEIDIGADLQRREREGLDLAGDNLKMVILAVFAASLRRAATEKQLFSLHQCNAIEHDFEFTLFGDAWVPPQK